MKARQGRGECKQSKAAERLAYLGGEGGKSPRECGSGENPLLSYDLAVVVH